MALLILCMKFKNYENGNKKKYSQLVQGSPNPGFMQEKVQKGDSLKKDSRELFFFLVLGSYECPESMGR